MLSEDLTQLPQADVIILGELHDSPIHHLNQATAVAAIAPRALVFEMLSPGQVQGLTELDRMDAETLGAALGWAESGWPDFEMYWPIFEAAPDVPLYGAALPRALVRGSVAKGPAESFAEAGGDPARYGLDQPLPEDQQAEREAMQMEAHCDALPAEMLGGMVGAQRLRDAAFADTVLQALEAHGPPVVLITGNGHARTDWGVPWYLSRAAPDVTVYALGQFESAPEEAPPFDGWLVTAPTERDDPCAAFR
ncbi:conserved hypothetical protein [Dinoroseobacter shibae DFL 12 = DSM 16493]|uniref:Haem-binding uptake Tiki superfamily ChaN domain-containing protein n=1 Tax=Dinoroseobacter shibae (strain DSM 16493 / NCIMB 14021 / DFL 12) TaxID=398580 RepID=A8LKC7_DINSH|nr:ChaN family lipoprotein [Dinoroseobacter shibae]ABV94710.1 conserved hypothetical protein [Dinoroseobacter shibae DFL 12 = DSM 16493]URF46132.1 ChaN family lipoprotein [Dinoroseobacter shibae]URF50439.1 ChaN family lipoprotein [Dinoroseobacter shibae]